MIFIAENTLCFRAILNTKIENTKDKDDNDAIIDFISHAVEKMMEKIITEKSPRNRGRSWCRPHNQSQKRLTFDSIFVNLLVGRQEVPARPRHIRLNLAEKERTIGSGELSDVLAKLVALYILDGHWDDFPLPRGRPKRKLSPESRGRDSYYDFSDLKKLVQAVLKELPTTKLLDDRLLSDQKLYRFLKYSFSSAFYQAKEDEEAFLNSFRPYGLSEQQLELNKKNMGPWILFKDLSKEKLENLAGAYAKKAIEHLKKNDLPIIYEIAIILDMIHAYD